jgi:hypothetical protein
MAYTKSYYSGSANIQSFSEPTFKEFTVGKGNILSISVYEFNASEVEPNIWKISASFESEQLVENPYFHANVVDSQGSAATSGTYMNWTEVNPLQEKPVEAIVGYYESKGTVQSNTEPQFSSVDVDDKSINLQNTVFSASKIAEGTWNVSFRGDTTVEYLGKVSVIIKLNGGESKTGFGLTFYSSSTKTDYTFKDASEAKVFIKDVNNTARQILADVNALESSKLKQERILNSADRLYD